MNHYIALLRGINVGGKNKVSMAILKVALSEAGLINVVTYINSGNIIFSDTSLDLRALEATIRTVIQDKFALDIPVVVIERGVYQDFLAHTPQWWGGIDEETVHNAVFLISPTEVEEVYAFINIKKDLSESVTHHQSIMFWSAPRATFTKSRLSKIAASSLNSKVTIRNANTVRMLLKLLNER